LGKGWGERLHPGSKGEGNGEKKKGTMGHLPDWNPFQNLWVEQFILCRMCGRENVDWVLKTSIGQKRFFVGTPLGTREK
jgi:hypothetical protein